MLLTDNERLELQETVRRLLGDSSDEAAVRATMETVEGYDAGLWGQLAEMGVVGLLIDESRGGSGFGTAELEIVMEEVGAALLCSPLLGSSVLAATLFAEIGDVEAGDEWLPKVADGSVIAAVALTGSAGCWTPEGVSVSAAADDELGWVLDGSASFVLHGQNADVLLVVANAADGLGCFLVEPSSPAVDIQPLPTFDHTLRLAELTFNQTPTRRLNAQGPVWDAVRVALDRSLVALAGEQAGAARRCLEFTVDYAKDRVQFGRAIGSFQAIKHMAADLLVETESSVSAARHAAKQLALGAGDATEAVSLAAFACADAFVKTAADSIQMHGGIAFTWEHPAHLYLRRARADAELFGSSPYHRERFMQALGA